MPLNPGGPRAARAWALLWPTICVLFVFATTFRLPYAFDDLDVIGEAALYASGAQSLTDLLFKPHNEHTIPLFRTLVWGATRVFGLDARPLRLLLIALHLGGVGTSYNWGSRTRRGRVRR